ncbi:MAG TPA: phosphoenolpyruvate hydrolase family protein [Mycobacteriales bacterium]|nr:phosphoenolpyruvate hydrolase family protein [Mycobacteriales bacterium]
MSRQEILAAMRRKVAAGQPIIGGGAGVGLSAKCAEAAGLDFIVIYNSGRYRMAGRSSMAGLMPYGDANQIVWEMAQETITVVDSMPVVAGVCGTDPFRVIPRFLRQLKDLGCAGIQNYPTVCLFDGMIRANLEETGLGFDKEVELVAEARALDLLTVAYVHSEDEARAMAGAGADAVVAHAGLTTSGTIGALTALSLDEAIEFAGRIRDAANSVNSEGLVFAHGGPIAAPDDAARVLREVPGIHGFLGASSMERLPTEVAMTEHMRRFVSLSLGGA